MTTSFCFISRDVLIVPWYELPGESHHNWIWQQFTPPLLAVIVFLLFVKQSSYKTLQCRSRLQVAALDSPLMWTDNRKQGWSGKVRDESTPTFSTNIPFLMWDMFFMNKMRRRTESPSIFSRNNNCNTYTWLMMNNFL